MIRDLQLNIQTSFGQLSITLIAVNLDTTERWNFCRKIQKHATYL